MVLACTLQPFKWQCALGSMPYFTISLCLAPDDFTCQDGNAGFVTLATYWYYTPLSKLSPNTLFGGRVKRKLGYNFFN